MVLSRPPQDVPDTPFSYRCSGTYCRKGLRPFIKGILAVYDKYDYLDEQKEALNKFADYVLSLADVKPI